MKHQTAQQTLKNAKGQLEAALKMLDEERYCVDISNQLMATIALIKRANKQILSEHLNHCVIESIHNQDAEAKIKEIEQLIERMM
ncbi:metal-sensing transcriptional repressor [Paracholeplasma manati]|uniref:Copper-sensing transcriptional repressor CsoR n=1 Tax=Paracholeplasma manati TaxID=591373 RepID=A0ABT2Y6D8_9MOLU|nr:metal-sensing transcriptional repressor [Paracholeplasma manati]MCV2232306.1 metal-sensing transcriptional repressor [Paracholeplasma manati]MDG0888263.1 metal-sensing transcriptional repressor [Paracholeplasma manati]